MKRNMSLWQLMGFAVTSLGGTLLHFLYDWTNQSLWAAPFSGVNESTWEHMKLLFVPTAVFTVVQLLFLGGVYPNFLAVRTVSLLAGLTLIPVLFYTYSGVLGRNVDWINISIFFLAAAGMFLLDAYLLRKGRFSKPWQQVVGVMILWALAFAFVWCTFRPPRLGLWQDPLTGTFGT